MPVCPPKTSPPDRPRYAALDAWRGVCALLIVIGHMPLLHPWLEAQWFTNMQLFVDFFFVLSGFVMAHAYSGNIESGLQFQRFMIRRFGRIWPLHAAMLAAFLVLELVKFVTSVLVPVPMEGAPFSGPRSLETLASNIFLIQSFGLHGMTSWNGPAWSISVEFYVYALFGVILLVVGRRTTAFAAMALIGCAGIILLSPHGMFTTHDFGFLRCLYGFFVGCIVCQLAGQPPLRGLGAAAEVAALLLIIAFMALTGDKASSLAAPLVFAFVVYVFAFERGPVSTLLLCTPAQKLGLWSYSIYMVHMLIFSGEKIVLGIVEKLPQFGLTALTTPTGRFFSFGGIRGDLLFFACQIIMTAGVAAFTYRTVEEPARRWFAALATRRDLAKRGAPPFYVAPPADTLPPWSKSGSTI